MGSNASTPGQPHKLQDTPVLQPQATDSGLLNTKDLESALAFVLNMGEPRKEEECFKLFQYVVDMKDATMSLFNSNKNVRAFLASDLGKEVSNKLLKILDADLDGRLTPRDFQIMHDKNLKGLIRRNEGWLNDVLPFAGQCAFGFTMGFAAGRLAHRMYTNRFAILFTSVFLYSGFQYLAQANVVQRRALEKAFAEKMHQLMDVDKDGKLSREDLNFLIENRLSYVATKLGPGGIAPGAAGYATLAVGLLRGMRRF